MTRRLLAALAVAALGLVACGGDDDASLGERPKPVSPDLAPAEISGGLKLFESTSKDTLSVFRNPGERTVVVDAKLWEIRTGARLVGALQISTVKDKVDLGERAYRNSIVGEILVGEADRIRVGDVEVYASGANDKHLYLWFGEGMFEILQLKGDELDHEQVLADVIEHQDGLRSWRPLPADVEAEE